MWGTPRHDSGGGIPVAFNLNGVVYYYQINSRGDITGIYDANGTLVVEYTYDAWGNPTGITGSMADTVGKMNPLRYRGYYYDAETGFYYLQSRYYDPVVGRFINADNIGGELGKLGSHNVFAYCQNNPVMFVDPNGHSMELFGSTYYISDKNLYDRYYSDVSKWPKGANGKPKYSYVYDPGFQEYYRLVRKQQVKNNIVRITTNAKTALDEDPSLYIKIPMVINSIQKFLRVVISSALGMPVTMSVGDYFFLSASFAFAWKDVSKAFIYLYEETPTDYNEEWQRAFDAFMNVPT